MNQDLTYIINHVFNNNVVLVIDLSSNKETILLGKGLGFQQKKGALLPHNDVRIEKKFYLEDEQYLAQYRDLLTQVDKDVFGISEEIIGLISKEFTDNINEYVHLALPDHIQFALYRIRNGLKIINPFLFEIKTLYSKEFSLAVQAAELLSSTFDIEIPESEIGFLALHIHSALNFVPVHRTVTFASLLADFVEMIEKEQKHSIDRSSTEYLQFVTNFRFAIERKKDSINKNSFLLGSIESTLPVAYSYSKRLLCLIETRLEIIPNREEITLLSIDIDRLIKRGEDC
ncbi:PRD domain-containing protein [Shimazuella sp. AN120528]|uniref:PRD domain-containing protein n=1 Tax=Shimazuella soli TaxID=1892854 RepID=UPI001F10F617|nr:PRD domain-containing protein [Shimazuella soli]MCH5586446.1 PRD domain-containing protein [Shimazuella soli]